MAPIRKILVVLAISIVPIYWIGSQVASYLADTETALLAVDANGGKFLWASGLNNAIPGPISVKNDRVFVAVATNPQSYESERKYQIQAFSATSGQKLWSFDPLSLGIERVDESIVSTPIWTNGDRLLLNINSDTPPAKQQILVPDRNGKPSQKTANIENVRQSKIVNIDAKTGKVNWSIDRHWRLLMPFAFDGLTVSGSTMAVIRVKPALDVILEVRNSDTGKLLWQTPIAPPAVQSTEVVYKRYRLFSNSKTIFVFDEVTGKISAYSSDTGKVKFQMTLQPLLAAYDRQYLLLKKSAASWIPGDYLGVNDSTIYNLNDRTVSAFDANSGIRRWNLDIFSDASQRNLDFSDIKCIKKSLVVHRFGVYLFCTGFEDVSPFTSTSTTLSIDERKGQTAWVTKYFQRQFIATNSKSLYGVLTDFDLDPPGRNRLIALAQNDGINLWQRQSNFELYDGTLVADRDRLFIVAKVPRWRLLVGAIE
jgi:outer membrane protein assembly factor BamB